MKDLASLATLHGHPVRFLPECDSTNRLARALARAGEVGVVVTDHQTAGRGRLGRTWSSEPGKNLLFSMILRPPLPPAEAPRAVLLWAASLAEALDVGLKWPNDLVDERGRKLGGLLAELEMEERGVRAVILGVGINVNQVCFPDLPEATSLALLRGAPQDRLELLSRAVAAIDATDLLDPAGLDRWRARARTLGRRVRIGEVEGLVTGVREDGALLIGDRAVLAGDVEELPTR